MKISFVNLNRGSAGIRLRSRRLEIKSDVFLNRAFWYKDDDGLLDQDREMYYAKTFNLSLRPMRVKKDGN
jgi:hypothetical protein